jgi:hypothetical protein
MITGGKNEVTQRDRPPDRLIGGELAIVAQMVEVTK